MNPANQACLIVTDGRLPSLCAAWAAGVCGGSPSRSAVAVAPRLRGAAVRTRTQRVRALQALCSLAEVMELPEQPEPAADQERPRSTLDRPGEPEAELSSAGFAQSTLLLAACHQAMARRLARVVWPIHIGDFAGLSGSPDQPPPLDLIADACDRAMLASQLASVDAGRASLGVTIELPYVDFTDKQMIEVALDLGVPLSGCWWCQREDSTDQGTAGGGHCGKCDECARWQRALSAASPGATLVHVAGAKQGQRTGA